MVLDLMQNVALLVALAVGLQMLARRLDRRPLAYRLAAGVLFGVVGVVGMMTPMHFAPGVIYDGRSIVLSLAGLFGGPVAASIAAAGCAAYRINLGGAGTLPGVLTILEAAALGVALRYLRKKDKRWEGVLALWLFGIVVHAIMLGLQLLLPEGKGWEVLQKVGPTVLVFYPLGFLTIAQVFLGTEHQRQAEAALRDREERYRSLFENNHAVMLLVDPETGDIADANPAASKFYGWSRERLIGKSIAEINTLSPQQVRAEIDKARSSQRNQFFFTHRLADGSLREVEVFSGPIRIEQRDLLYSIIHDVTDQMRAEEALRENEERFRTLVEGAPDAIFVQCDRRFAYVNRAALELFGVSSPALLLGQDILDRVHPSVRDDVRRRLDLLNAQKQKVPTSEEIYLRLDGGEVPVEVSAVPTIYDGKNGAIFFARDISSRKQLESQLLQAQKMEAVGRLAGGVAHDFNNMLQTILGYTDMLLAETGPTHPFNDRLREIHNAADRSADLTRQLLGFARKQTIAPQPLDLNAGISNMLKMLERLIGENVNLLWKPCEGSCPVTIDPTQVDQVLANLVVNARDAIPDVGRITIETAHCEFDEEYCKLHPEFRPGCYEMLAVSDTGKGMDKETLKQAFEPFFTTKNRDQGTGLGLAMVYGIVKQNNGFINIYSEPSQGTTIRIYLPKAEDRTLAPKMPASNSDEPVGSETVLLVEDERALLKLSQTVLKQLGYTVLATGDPREALRIGRERFASIDVLMTDVVMPEMSGQDLWRNLKEFCPDMRCLFMSGYTDNVIAHHGVLDKGVHFLQKPFSTAALANKLREVLDGDAEDSASQSKES